MKDSAPPSAASAASATAVGARPFRSRQGRRRLPSALPLLPSALPLLPVVLLLLAFVGASPARAGTLPPAASPVAGGLRIPDVMLVDQDGRKVRFWSDLVKGKVVAVSFVFTSCTTICPPLGANFGRVRQLLGSRAGSSVQLISVSVDPAADTPQRLKAWAAQFGGGPGWTLVTGPRPEVEQLLRALQAYTPNFSDHSPLILIGNAATGTWERTSGLGPAAGIAARLISLGAPSSEARQATP